MSATSNKSRILLLLMMVVALVFFVSSFLAASLNGAPPATTGTADQQLTGSNCLIVRNAEDRYFADCIFN